MTNPDYLEPAFKGLAKLQIALEKKGGPSTNGNFLNKF
jgi:hypothetical protein